NYEYASRNPKEIELIHDKISEIDLSGTSANEKKAYLINAYNLLVIYQVIESYPLSRPLDREGFFDQVEYQIDGKQLTLNELESDVLFGEFKDPRLHFALACAAMSCPKLYNLAFQPERIDELLDERTRLSINDGSFIRVNKELKEVHLSKIFEWYKSDFEQKGESVLGFINRYRVEKIPSDYKIKHYEYDWTLNERKS
ncbi:MAG: DUF547 domain-containing protein, partial [Bacteroidota bacterium]